MIGMILNVVHGRVTVQNKNKKIQRKHKAKESKGLFTRREGYPCARLTLASRLKLAVVYKQISQGGLPYHLGQLYQLCCRVSSCVTFFVTVQDLK